MRLEVPPAPFYRGKGFFSGLDVPIRIIHVERGPSFPPHRHDFTELVLAYSGSGIHAADGQSRCVARGDVILVPRGSEHAYVEAGSLSYVNVIFDSAVALDDPLSEGVSLAPSLEKGSGVVYFSLSASALGESLALVNRIDQELFRKEAGYGLMAKALFIQLWAHLSREREWGRSDGESSESRVRRLADRLARVPSLGLSVDEMAAEARTSPRNFRREFKRITGESPLARVSRLRIDEAKGLLGETDKTVTQIALLVGFEDPAYFARAFRRAEGLSPKAYRESHG